MQGSIFEKGKSRTIKTGEDRLRPLRIVAAALIFIGLLIPAFYFALLEPAVKRNLLKEIQMKEDQKHVEKMQAYDAELQRLRRERELIPFGASRQSTHESLPSTSEPDYSTITHRIDITQNRQTAIFGGLQISILGGLLLLYGKRQE